MLSYPIDEAEALLSSKLTTAKQNMANCEEDLDFLREQITVGLPTQWHKLANYENITDGRTDNGGSNSESLQLGCHNEAEREE